MELNIFESYETEQIMLLQKSNRPTTFNILI